MDLSGTWRARAADDDLRRIGVGLDLDDGDWPEIAVPGHWRTAAAFADSDGPLLYRTSFDLPIPSDDRRAWVRLGGAFYQADVWLDGAYLGDPEGYFVPAAFDITALARLSEHHVLAVEVSCPPQTSDRGQRTLTGTFQGPAGPTAGWNPGGLWRPVEVLTTGPVRIDRCRVLCRDANASRAHLRLAVRLDSDRACTVQVATVVDGDVLAEHDHALATGANDLAWTLDISEPRLWWPWSLGDQPLTGVSVEVRVDGELSDRHHLLTGLREVALDDGVVSVNGERLFLKGATTGPTHLDLATVDAPLLRRDVESAREAGLDLLRLKGHITRDELYSAADELGMLIWQDLPLHGGYARSVRRQAVEQARAAVDVLGHHPSIVLWCAHDSPETRTVGHQLPTWNKTILDRWVKRALEKADETRPVIAHSGVAPHLPQLESPDSHLWFGWGRGEVRDLPRFAAAMPSMVRFVSEFGAQSVPDSCDFVDPMRWPRLDWDGLVERHGLDRDRLSARVDPTRSASFAAWREATQDYQAELVRLTIETLRRLKYHPAGGFCVSSLVDAAPRVSTSLLDHRRRPKVAFHRVTDACRPVIVVADAPPLVVSPGQRLELAVHVVSDLRRALESVRCTATVTHSAGTERWQWTGQIGADECVRIGEVGLRVPDAPGTMAIDLVLEHADVAVTNRYESTIVR